MLCLSLPLYGEGAALSLDGGTLWVEGEHGSGFLAGSLSLKAGLAYAVAGAGGVFSDLPAFDTEYTGAWFNAGLNPALQGFPLGVDLSGGFFRRDTLKAEVFGVPIESGGANGYFLGLALPLRLGPWTVAPSGLWARVSWEDGDLYWFFGKPQVPDLFAVGFSVAFREEHRLDFRYLSLNLNILDNPGEDLFTAHGDGAAVAYRWSFSRKPFRLDAAPGWLFITGGMNGGLTSGNQRYFLFPYLFFNAAAKARVHALFGVLEAEYRRPLFRLKVTLGAAHILSGDLTAEVHSKEKNLSYLGLPIFTGREETYSLSLDAGGLGAAFLSIEGGLTDLPLGRKGDAPRLSLTAKKLFALPWGYERFSASGLAAGTEPDTGASPAGGGISLASILLSGLSFLCSIAW